MRYLPLRLVFALAVAAYAINAQGPTSADDFSQRGISRFEKNDFEGAIADFTKVIELKGQNLEFCFYFRGIALYRLGKLDEALADLSQAITLKQHPRFYDDRGNLLAQKGDLNGAISDLNRALEMQPTYAKAYGDRAIVHLLRSETTDAEQDLQKCFELDKALESQFASAVAHLRQRLALRVEHVKPSDIDITKFSWTEEAARASMPTPKPTMSAPTTGVSQTGLRVLGDPTAKDQPGPPSLLDPSSTALPASRDGAAQTRGVNYKFTASLRNTGNKTIISVEWAYVFSPKDGHEPVAYGFGTKTNIPPGKEKNLTEEFLVGISKEHMKLPTKYNRDLFDERVVILRLYYSDGTSWRSLGKSQ
jgi:tetratricopeptide repeat protein